MKKFTRIVLTCVLVLALCVGCNPAQTPENTTPQNGGTQNEAPQNGGTQNETPPTETNQ